MRYPGITALVQLVGAASGLEYLHSHNIVHGDLKGVSGHVCRKVPSDQRYAKVNILVDSGHSTRLADFGLTTIIGESTTAGTVSVARGQGGTTRWMAPEIMHPQLFGFPDDCRKQLPSKGTDIYALGMTVLEVRASTTE